MDLDDNSEVLIEDVSKGIKKNSSMKDSSMKDAGKLAAERNISEETVATFSTSKDTISTFSTSDDKVSSSPTEIKYTPRTLTPPEKDTMTVSGSKDMAVDSEIDAVKKVECVDKKSEVKHNESTIAKERLSESKSVQPVHVEMDGAAKKNDDVKGESDPRLNQKNEDENGPRLKQEKEDVEMKTDEKPKSEDLEKKRNDTEVPADMIADTVGVIGEIVDPPKDNASKKDTDKPADAEESAADKSALDKSAVEEAAASPLNTPLPPALGGAPSEAEGVNSEKKNADGTANAESGFHADGTANAESAFHADGTANAQVSMKTEEALYAEQPEAKDGSAISSEDKRKKSIERRLNSKLEDTVAENRRAMVNYNQHGEKCGDKYHGKGKADLKGKNLSKGESRYGKGKADIKGEKYGKGKADLKGYNQAYNGKVEDFRRIGRNLDLERELEVETLRAQGLNAKPIQSNYYTHRSMLFDDRILDDSADGIHHENGGMGTSDSTGKDDNRDGTTRFGQSSNSTNAKGGGQPNFKNSKGYNTSSKGDFNNSKGCVKGGQPMKIDEDGKGKRGYGLEIASDSSYTNGKIYNNWFDWNNGYSGYYPIGSFNGYYKGNRRFEQFQGKNYNTNLKGGDSNNKGDKGGKGKSRYFENKGHTKGSESGKWIHDKFVEMMEHDRSSIPRGPRNDFSDRINDHDGSSRNHHHVRSRDKNHYHNDRTNHRFKSSNDRNDERYKGNDERGNNRNGRNDDRFDTRGTRNDRNDRYDRYDRNDRFNSRKPDTHRGHDRGNGDDTRRGENDSGGNDRGDRGRRGNGRTGNDRGDEKKLKRKRGRSESSSNSDSSDTPPKRAAPPPKKRAPPPKKKARHSSDSSDSEKSKDRRRGRQPSNDRRGRAPSSDRRGAKRAPSNDRIIDRRGRRAPSDGGGKRPASNDKKKGRRAPSSDSSSDSSEEPDTKRKRRR